MACRVRGIGRRFLYAKRRLKAPTVQRPYLVLRGMFSPVHCHVSENDFFEGMLCGKAEEIVGVLLRQSFTGLESSAVLVVSEV